MPPLLFYKNRGAMDTDHARTPASSMHARQCQRNHKRNVRIRRQMNVVPNRPCLSSALVRAMYEGLTMPAAPVAADRLT